MTRVSSLATFYPESSFGGFSDIDGAIAFYARINALIKSSFRIVDFGCGRGVTSEDPVIFRRNLACLKGKVAKVIGLDVDIAGSNNPMLDDFHRLGNDLWPLENKSVDLVIADHVIEHLPNPEMFFSEAKRVLVQGGYLCLRTPNVLGYVGIASKLAPNMYHKRLLANARKGRKEEDTFPTLYRCNTVWAIKRQLTTSGFRAVVYGYDSEPNYLNFSKLAYSLGVLHQKFAPGFLRLVIFGFGQLM
jgi:SAM-dependent methyltransferase